MAITPWTLSAAISSRWVKLTFSVENLLNEEYTTLWGQRAPPLLYSPTYGSPSLYEYKGQGRTFGLNYALTFLIKSPQPERMGLMFRIMLFYALLFSTNCPLLSNGICAPGSLSIRDFPR